MINNWNDILRAAKPFVDFLGSNSYFQSKYTGPLGGKLILTDAYVAMDYATDDSFDSFDEWQTVSDSPNTFPDDFEWMRFIDYNLKKNEFFGFFYKNFNGADEKWINDGACMLLELMQRDIRIIFHCYANEYFPDIWSDILEVYLMNGFPCGWKGRYPVGELVVFSNL